jgi:hypothetical protein
MIELEIAGRKYRTGKLNAKEQFHIVRRLAPLLAGLGESLSQIPTPVIVNGLDNEQTNSQDVDVWRALEPVAEALSQMTDADCDYVLNVCLSKASRFNGQNWGPIWVNGQPMFEDELDLSAMMQLTITTIQENLGNFFQGAPQRASDVASTPPSN